MIAVPVRLASFAVALVRLAEGGTASMNKAYPDDASRLQCQLEWLAMGMCRRRSRHAVQVEGCPASP